MAVRPIEVFRSFRLVGTCALSPTLCVCRQFFRSTTIDTKEAAGKRIVMTQTRRVCHVKEGNSLDDTKKLYFSRVQNPWLPLTMFKYRLIVQTFAAVIIRSLNTKQEQ